MDLIVGAGISGLAYAAALPHDDYLIVEKENQIGGYCKTVYKDDYVWDYSGHFFHFQRPNIRDFVIGLMAKEEILKVFKNTQIYYNGILVDYPFQMNIHQLEKDEFIDCLYDLFDVQETNFETFKTMLYTKFGKSIAEKFLIPYNEKLYATDLNKLDVDAMGRFFPFANKEEIILNFKKEQNLSYNSFFLYPKKGAIKIIDSIATHVDKDKISLGEYLISVDLSSQIAQTNKRTIKYDNLVSSIPFPFLLDACKVNYDVNTYSWNKVLVFNLGFDKKGNDIKNNWIYFPDSEYVFYRVGFYDNIIGQNKMSLYVEIGFNHLDDVIIDEKLYLDRVLNDLMKVGIVTDHKLIAHCSVLMDPAYVHITKESEKDKVDKMNLLNSKSVYSIGRYGEWKYCSLEDNIYDAFKLVDKICNL